MDKNSKNENKIIDKKIDIKKLNDNKSLNKKDKKLNKDIKDKSKTKDNIPAKNKIKNKKKDTKEEIEIIEYLDNIDTKEKKKNNNTKKVSNKNNIKLTIKEIKYKKLKKIKNATKIFKYILLVMFIILFIFSLYNIILWFKDNKNTSNIEDSLKDINIETVQDNENTEIINEPTDEFDPYWDYIKIPLISVDFTELKKKNKNTVGWLFVNNTNINYPVVQGKNNSYYLSVSFDEKYSDAGWIFMDYRNKSDLSDRNTVIYGHSRKNMSLFGTLRNVVKKSWYTDNENYVVKFSTPTENTLWQVFSTYTIEAEDYYIKTSFKNDSEYEKWLSTVKNRSVFNYKTTVNKNDKILTLSSCYTSDGIRVVLHAKLIKKETR